MNNHHYLRLALSPATDDALTLRQSIQKALTQSFGNTLANLHVDILWVAEDGAETVIRVPPKYVVFAFSDLGEYSYSTPYFI